MFLKKLVMFLKKLVMFFKKLFMFSDYTNKRTTGQLVLASRFLLRIYIINHLPSAAVSAFS